MQYDPPALVTGAAWSPDGKRLLTIGGYQSAGGTDNTAKIWDATTGKMLLVYRNHTGFYLSDCDWSPDGKRVATFGSDGTARVWDPLTGEDLLILKVPVNMVLFGRWSPDGEHLAIFGDDTLVSVWRVWQSTQELIDYAKQCCVFRELTKEERALFGLP